LLFLHIQNGVKSGTLNLQHSYKYRPLDDYLIERGRWSRDKELLLERVGLQALANPRTDERDLLFHPLVFSAGERESAYVIDGLMHNDVVRSDIHSTDHRGP